LIASPEGGPGPRRFEMSHTPSIPAGPGAPSPDWRKPAVPTTEACHREAVGRVIREMRTRLDEPLPLRALAEIAAISPYHFSRVFRQVTGIPPCQFLYALRLEVAKRLLLTTDVSVTDVCFEVGYNSLGTFIRRFNDLLGLSPSRLRSLAQAPVEGLFGEPAEPSPAAAGPATAGPVGSVSAPENFRGLVFVGLFTTPLPQGRPLAGTVLGGPGGFRLPPVPDGRYHLFTAGLSNPVSAADFFLHESTLRGGGQLVSVRGGQSSGLTDLRLRAPESFDPPILMTLPLLLGDGARPRSGRVGAPVAAGNA
jgi:AraC family transcriptional regulator